MKMRDRVNRRFFVGSLMTFVTGNLFITKVQADEKELVVGKNHPLSNEVISINISDIINYQSRNNDRETILVSNEVSNSAREERYSSFFVRKEKINRELIDGVMFIQGKDSVWERVIEGGIYPEWFGAQGDGKTDDTAAFIKANKIAHLYQVPLYLTAANVYCLSDSFTIDASKTCWTCMSKATLSWIQSNDNTPAIKLISTQSDYKKRHVNVTEVLSNISLIGKDIGALFNSPAIQVGDENTNSCLFTVKNVSIQGWKKTLLFAENAWRIKFENCQFLWGHIETIRKYQNSGECMVFDNCMFADNTSFTRLYYGDWNFIGCSFDNHEIKAAGNSNVFVVNSHMENPGRNSEYYVIGSVESSEAYLSVTNSFIFLNKKETIIKTTLFNIAEGNNSGLYLDNVKIVLSDNYDPSKGHEGVPLLIGGEGRGEIGKLFIESKYLPCISKFDNVVFQNPMFSRKSSDWDLEGDVAHNITSGVQGQSFLRMNSPKSSIGQMAIINDARIISGAIKFRAENCFADVVMIFFDFNKNEVFRDDLSAGVRLDDGWQLIKYSKNIPSGTRFISIKLKPTSDNDNCTIQIGYILFNYI